MQQVINKEDLRLALLRIDALWTAKKGTKEGDELNLLVDLVSEYEDSLIIEERKNQSEIQLDIDDL
jgi:hypothetical protein